MHISKKANILCPNFHNKILPLSKKIFNILTNCRPQLSEYSVVLMNTTPHRLKPSETDDCEQ